MQPFLKFMINTKLFIKKSGSCPTPGLTHQAQKSYHHIEWSFPYRILCILYPYSCPHFRVLINNCLREWPRLSILTLYGPHRFSIWKIVLIIPILSTSQGHCKSQWDHICEKQGKWYLCLSSLFSCDLPNIIIITTNPLELRSPDELAREGNIGIFKVKVPQIVHMEIAKAFRSEMISTIHLLPEPN